MLGKTLDHKSYLTDNGRCLNRTTTKKPAILTFTLDTHTPAWRRELFVSVFSSLVSLLMWRHELADLVTYMSTNILSFRCSGGVTLIQKSSAILQCYSKA